MEKEKKPEEKGNGASELRTAAEKKLSRSSGRPPDMKEKGSEGLLHELQVHQIELEMQNEELRRTQLALEESRQRYADLYDFAPVGFFTLTQEAVIKEVNLTGSTLLGVGRQKLINVRFRKMVVSKDQDLWDQHFLRALREEARQTCDLVIKRQDGSTFSAGLESIRMEISGEVFEVHTTVSDVTERKKAEEKLRESEETFRTLAENANEGILIAVDKGIHVFVNTRACEITGYSKTELLKIGFQALIRPDEVQKLMEIFNKRLAGEPIPLQFETISIRKDGKSLPVELTGAKTVWHGQQADMVIVRDISERKQAQEAQARYRNFLENIDDICFESDLDGNLIFANQAARRLLELKEGEVLPVPMDYRSFVLEERVDQYLNLFKEVNTSGNPLELYNFEISRRGGELGYLDIVISLIRDEQGHPTGFRVIARDVTVRKRMEEEQELLRKQFIQKEKFEAIGTLAGGIAHDFNNLLMGIQGYASIMLMDIDSTHSHFEPLKAIEFQVKSAADLTKQLLGYARSGRYEVKSTDLNELVGKTVSLFGRTKKELRIHEEYEKSLWITEVDRGQIEQVLLNLFINAAQAMPGGGALYIKTENIIMDEVHIRLYNAIPGPYVKISVTDTGLGMDEETKRRIFEPFYTTQDMGRHGLGLGLATAYGIIKGHKGIIDVYSEKGHGATFTIYLPASQKALIKQTQPAGTLRNKPRTILLVDDEKTIRDVAGAMLERLGHQVLIADGGEEAFIMYRLNRDRIELVIMDMIMPDMVGGEAIGRIRSINPDVKVILSSGYSLNSEAQEIMKRGGVQSFLQKPFQLEELAAKITEVFEN